MLTNVDFTKPMEERELNLDELDDVSGGSGWPPYVDGTFKYGNFEMYISANKNGYAVCTNNGSGGPVSSCIKSWRQ